MPQNPAAAGTGGVGRITGKMSKGAPKGKISKRKQAAFTKKKKVTSVINANIENEMRNRVLNDGGNLGVLKSEVVSKKAGQKVKFNAKTQNKHLLKKK